MAKNRLSLLTETENPDFTRVKIARFFFFGLSVVNGVLIYAKPPFKLKILGRKAKTAPPP